MKAPCLFAGFRIERRNVGAAFAASADTLHDLPFGNEWPACELPPIGWIGDWLIPHQGACFDIESDDVEIRRARKQLVAVQGHIAFHARPHAFRQFSGVMPQFIACGCIESLHIVIEAMNKDDAVVDQRRCFVRSRWNRERPYDVKVLHVVSGDLLQRTESQIVIRTPPCEPVANRRVAQHRVRYRRNRVEWITRCRPWRQHRVGRNTTTGRIRAKLLLL